MHPREFGNYRILKLLPPGGMGRVYLAEHVTTGRRIALKLIDSGPDRERAEIAEAERRGATLQERLCRIDPRIADVLGYGDLDNFFYIEMEYIDGEDLSEVLSRGPLGVPFAARIGCDLCETLILAHGFTAEIDGHSYRGVVHGDLKPRNVRITPDGQVRVLDFGIAKALSHTRQATTNQFGSSQYSSPERLNTGEVDFASDLWSVAVVLYETVTGRPYFEADNGPKLDYLIRNYRQHQPLPPGLPAGFAAILYQALHPNPVYRYRSAGEFAADLRAFLEGRQPEAQRLPPPSAEPADDLERTRRTAAPPQSAIDSEATRRTTPQSAAAAPPYVPHEPPKPFRPAGTKRLLTPRRRQIRAAITLAVLLGIFWFIGNEISVWQAGQALRTELETDRLTDMDAAWTRYTALAKRNHAPLVLWGTRRAVLSRMIGFADRVIDEYRNSEAPSVSEGDWIRAKGVLDKALELDPGDREIRGKRFLAEGHIARIRGTAKANGRLLNEARSKFEQSSQLLGGAPDPYLGLARLYVYALKDVERAEEALRQADRRGHEMGRREKAQLGDGYRDRAERLLREADRAAGLPEERDFLKRAKKDFERAEDYYRDIVPFAGSATTLRRVLDSIAHLDVRMDHLEEGS
ncbi:MAG TPA: serine/threonine-protein kinase [Bryobacteraceae bacterium]|nr:serine/threonine-protein kinase [Bryobacteraceae bacterium]